MVTIRLKSAFGSAGQKKFFKVKYASGALSYGAKIQRNAYIKNHIDLCTLQFLCAFSWLQEAMYYLAIVFVDFTLKIFSGLLHFIVIDRN
jgi:hypothetical protein